jgi:hypothetical protein
MRNTLLDGIVEGAFDVHVHAAPSLFPRWGDAVDLARACAGAKMAGVVLKAHEGSTVEAARLLARVVPELEVVGGVVLNDFVGGLNPLAVELCLALGGRVIWLPTIHSRCHGERIGLGAFSFQGTPLAHTPARGFAVTGDDGRLLPAVRDILALLDGSGAVLATGHIAPAEIRAVQRAIEDEGRDIRLLVNHAFFTAPGLTIDELRELARPWTYFEACYLSVCPLVQATEPAAVAAAIEAVPEGRWILASDSGQETNPPAPEALARFAASLGEAGLAEAKLIEMLRDNPKELLAR